MQPQTSTKQLVSFPFSWKNQRENAATAIYLSFAPLLVIGLFYVLFHNEPYMKVPIIVASFMMLLVGWFGVNGYSAFLRTPAKLQAYIAAWHEIAEKTLLEKQRAIARIHVMDTDENRHYFTEMIQADKQFIENYDKSEHIEQLALYEKVMRDKNLLQRLIAILKPYSFWQKRMMAHAI